VKAAGYDAVLRYIGFDPAVRRKCVTKAEYDDQLANGVAVAFVYEDDTGTALQGRGRGQDDARAVLTWADAIGAPVPACYFAGDFDAQPDQYPAIDDYFRGAADVLGPPRVGAYGSFYVINHMFDTGLITFGWQTVAWSHGMREPRAHLFQRLGTVTVDGVNCDVNDILQDDFGQCPGPSEDDMTPEQDVLLRDIHEQLCGGGSRTPGPYSGWETWEGTKRSLTVVDLLREAHRETTMRLPSRVAGSTVSDTVLGYACNADAYGNRLVQHIGALTGKLDGLTLALGQLTQHGTVDLAAVAKAAEDGAKAALDGFGVPESDDVTADPAAPTPSADGTA
jgi:hypothetical protein